MKPQRLGGEVQIEISGPRCEQLVNMAVTRGISMWGLTREDETLRTWIEPADFSSLRPLVRETNCSVHILQRRGVSFWWRSNFHRRSMVVGLVVCLLVLVFMSSLVWVIEVEGAEEVDADAVLTAAHEEGLTPGTWRHNLVLTDIARAIERRIPAVTWVGLHMQGVKVTIEVLDKTGYSRLTADAVVDIVAAEDATVKEIYVLAGTPEVTEGMTVSRGDVLIRGYAAVEGLGAVSASGTVRGLVRHMGLAEVQLDQKVMVPTGRKMVSTFISVGGLQLPLGWRREKEEFPFEHYRLQREAKTLSVGWPKPLRVEIERLKFEEFSDYIRNLTLPEAEQLALAKAGHRMRSEIPQHAVVLETESTVTLTEDTVVAQVRGMSLQDVGVERPIEEQSGDSSEKKDNRE